MPISKQFLNSLNIPSNAWLTQTIGSQPHLVLTSEKYCPVFWVGFIGNEVSRSDYDFPGSIPHINLSQHVFINQRTHELLVPPSYTKSPFWRGVFGIPEYDTPVWFFNRFPTHTILTSSVGIIVFIVLITLFCRVFLLKTLNILLS